MSRANEISQLNWTKRNNKIQGGSDDKTFSRLFSSCTIKLFRETTYPSNSLQVKYGCKYLSLKCWMMMLTWLVTYPPTIRYEFVKYDDDEWVFAKSKKCNNNKMRVLLYMMHHPCNRRRKPRDIDFERQAFLKDYEVHADEVTTTTTTTRRRRF